MKSWRVAFFAVLCVTCVAIPVLYVLSARRAAEGPLPGESPLPVRAPATSSAPPPAPRPIAPSAVPAPAASLKPSHAIVYRYTGVDAGHGKLARGELEAPEAPVTFADLRCERVHMVHGGGVCLMTHRRTFPVRHEAVLFDGDFQVRHTLALSGVPSRVKVSPDGRLAAVTVFESGHSYAAAHFSTRTSIIDLARGDFVILDLEKLPVLRGGAPFQAIDLNVWGVTFTASGDRFYATLATGGRTYLVDGDVAKRQMQVLREGVECPSLSPDGTRIAFKRREAGRLTAVTWRLSVVRLDTGEEWALAETRSVDDQVEWLDDATVLYSLPEAASGTPVQNSWAVPADGGGSPRLVMPKAYSLVVVRNAAVGDRGRREPQNEAVGRPERRRVGAGGGS